jgi:hypothetical protein
MAHRSENYLDDAMNSEEQRSSHIALRQLNGNLQWLQVWRQEHHHILERVAESSTRREQVINTRRELVKLIENVSMAQPFFLDEFTEEDKRLLAAKLHPDMALDEVMAMEVQLYIFSDASSLCPRLIAFELGDARRKDLLSTATRTANPSSTFTRKPSLKRETLPMHLGRSFRWPKPW